MDEYCVWDNPWYNLALGDRMRRFGLAINDAYRLNELVKFQRYGDECLPKL